VLPDGASDQLAELIKNAVIAAVQASVNLGQARHL
jgi:hypothetical protein